jgi:hypothetical protein
MDYKKYSLEKLEEWMHDAMSSDASPHEIYSTIREAVRENYNYHREQVSHAYGLLELLSGHRPVEDKSMLSCDKDDPSPECKGAWNDFWEGVDDEVRRSLEEKGYEWTPLPQKEDKVVKWQLPVQLDGLSGECYVQFPDDLLEAANLKEGDTVEWVEQGDGSYLLRKV